jgi:hypothetical protein
MFGIQTKPFEQIALRYQAQAESPGMPVKSAATLLR